MTVAAKNPLELYDGDGVTTAFAARWRYLSTATLLVEKISPAGDATVLQLGLDYSATAGETDAGGTVSLFEAPAVGDRLRIRRVTPQAQQTDYPATGSFPSESHERALDRLTMIAQEQGEALTDVGVRALQVPFGETAPTLPPASGRPGKFLAFDATGNPYYAAGMGSDADLRTDLAQAGGSALLGFRQFGTGAVPRSVYEKGRETISVKDFGAKGDGVTNDTAAILLADAAARDAGDQLYFPSGIYMVSQVVVHTGSNWTGEGRDTTTIKSIAGSNKDTVYGFNSDANWGASNPDNFVVGYTLRNLTIDGNRAGNTSGSGIAVYGARPIIENVYIKNCAEHHLRTEYTDDNFGGLDTWAMEGCFYDIRMDTCGKDGWLNNGPHDSVDINVIVIDAGQSAANTYDGVYFGPKSNGRHVALHCWTRSWSVRARTAIYIEDGAAGHDFMGCHFEGGYVANVIMKGTRCLFDDTCRYYAAWNGINMLLSGPACTTNTIKGSFLDAGPGRPACIGIKIGAVPGDYVTGNLIDVNMSGQEGQNFAFDANNTGQDNSIRAKCYNTTNATITGMPSVSDDVDLVIRNSTGKVRINTKNQKKSLTVGANASVTWTFDYPFEVAPFVAVTPKSPSGPVGNSVTITAHSPTSVTFTNDNAVSMTLLARAEA